MMGGINYLNIFPTLSYPIIGVDGSNTIAFKKLFFFFLIGNKKKILLIKKKLANLSTLEMYYGGKNQESKLQWSSKAGRKKQEKCDKTTLQTRRVCKRINNL